MGVHDEFAGVIGRDWRDSTPWWPARPEAARGRAQRGATSCSTTSGTRSSGATGPTSRRPNIDGLAGGGRAARQLPHHRAVLADACVPAHRAQPPLERHGPRRRPRHRLSRATRAIIPPENGFLSEILAHARVRDVRGRQVAPHARGRDAHGRRPRAAGRSGAGFDRWYGFHGGETHQFVPTLYHDNHAVPAAADRRPRATTSPRTSPTTRSSTSATCATSTPSSRSSSTSPPARATRPTTRRRSGSSATAASSTTGGTRCASATFARQIGARPRARGHRAVAPPAVGAGVGRARTRRPSGRGAVHGVLRRLPLAHRRADRPGARVPRRDRRRSTTRSSSLVSDNGASAEGGATRLDQRRPHAGTASRRGARELRARIDELGGPSPHNNYPWGWTMAGNTPFRRWKREVHEGGVADPCIVRWPARFAGDAGQIRHQFAHAIDVLPTVLELIGIDPPAAIRGLEQSPIDGTSFAYAPGRRAARPRPGGAPRSTSRCSVPRAIYHDGWKAVTFKPLGPMYDDLSPNAMRRSTTTSGSCTTSPRTCRRCTTSPPTSPNARRAWSSCGGRRRARYHVLPLDNRILLHDPQPAVRTGCASAARYRYLPHGAPVPESVAVDVRNRSHEITASVEIPEGVTPEGVLLALGCVLGGWSLHVLDGQVAVHAQPLRQGARRHHLGGRARRRAAHAGVPLRQAERRGRTRRAAGRWRRRRHRGDPAVHADPVQQHRRRPELWLRARAAGGGGVRRHRSGSAARFTKWWSR